MTITTVLDRLEGVRQTGSGRWIARCPGPLHENGDRHPSLSIRETADRKLLVRCFTGCNTGDVLAAVGLPWAALFPYGPSAPEHCASTSISAADLLAVISEDVTTIAIIGADLLENRSIAEEDWQRLAKAVARIGAAKDHCHG